MFQDEGRFGLTGAPRRCWTPRGLRPTVGVRLQRQYLYAFSVVSPHDGVLDRLVLSWVNAGAMSLSLAEAGRRHASEFVLRDMDQARRHLAAALAVPSNMRLLFLPPYCPEPNPVEHLWEALREECFANHVPTDLDQVDQILADGLRTLADDPARVQSMTGLHWTTGMSMKAN